MGKTKQIWVIRAGRGGEAHSLFLEGGVIALADAKLGDLAKLKITREAFCDVYRKLHSDETCKGAAGIAGKFFRFAHEVQAGDFVLYPALADKQVYVGEVTSSYSFSSTSRFPHQRTVMWKCVMAKAALSQRAGYELGAARTFFLFSKNVQELLQIINSGSAARFQQRAKAT